MMFGIGFWETIVILLVIIIFIRPDDIPNFIRKVGRLFGELKHTYDMFIDNFKEIETNLKRPVDAYIPAEYKKKSKKNLKSQR